MVKKEFILFIGLGNFPIQYNDTRHNIGKDFLLFLYSNTFEEKKLYFCYHDVIDNKDCIFVIPKTYMNVSGDIFKDSYLKKIIIENIVKIIIIHDDLEVPFGKYKLRNNIARGERGHNGNRSITQSLKTIQQKEYEPPYYLSIGIGRPINELIDAWVVKKFSLQEIKYLKDILYINLKNELSIIINQLK